MHRTWLRKLCKRGRVPGVRSAARGKQTLWYVPMSVTAAQFLPAPIEGPLRAARCDCCGIVLERSGDETHPNDTPDAGRCWSCCEDYGLGPVGPEVTGEYAEEREGAIDGRDDLYRSGAVRAERNRRHMGASSQRRQPWLR